MRKKPDEKEKIRRFAIIAGIGLLLVSFGGYHFHLKPVLQLRSLKRALGLVRQKADLAEVQKEFEIALSYRTFGSREARKILTGSVEVIASDARFSPENRAKLRAYAIEELKKDLWRSAKDAESYLLLASLLRSEPRTRGDLAEAEILMQEALRIAPHMQLLYFELAEIYATKKEPAQMLAVLEKAHGLAPEFTEAKLKLALAALDAGRLDIYRGLEAEIHKLLLNLLSEQDLLRLVAIFDHSKIKNPARAKEVHLELTRRFGESR